MVSVFGIFRPFAFKFISIVELITTIIIILYLFLVYIYLYINNIYINIIINIIINITIINKTTIWTNGPNLCLWRKGIADRFSTTTIDREEQILDRDSFLIELGMTEFSASN